MLVITRGYKDLVKIRAMRLQGRARETPIVMRARSYKASAGMNSDGIRWVFFPWSSHSCWLHVCIYIYTHIHIHTLKHPINIFKNVFAHSQHVFGLFVKSLGQQTLFPLASGRVVMPNWCLMPRATRRLRGSPPNGLMVAMALWWDISYHDYPAW